MKGEVELADIEQEEASSAWQKLKHVAHIVPAEALALYGRWWQLETWLRELLYVELKAKFGVAWEEQFPARMRKYASNDQRHAYMSSPDAPVVLTYLDAGDLFDLVEGYWKLVSHGLIDDLDVWRGRVRELQKIRRRIAHCRRPHTDDLGRVEQTLRDVDASAHAAVSAFNRPSWIVPVRGHPDPLMRAWVDQEHSDAQRLLEHVERQYDITFRLHYSRRPWAPRKTEGQAVSGTPGYLWHATWTFRGGIWDPGGFWNDDYMDPYRHLIVFALADPFSVELSFPAVSDPEDLNQAISYAFEAVVAHHRSPIGYREGALTGDFQRWYAHYAARDWRLQMESVWNIVEDRTPCSMFRA